MPLISKSVLPLLAFVLPAQALADPTPTATPLAFGPYVIADIAEKVTPAVVNITTERGRRGAGASAPGGHNSPLDHPFFREFFPPGMPQQPQREVGQGSGVVISPDGFIVTNNHVIEGADEIKVAFSDKRELKAKLIGADKASDVALLKVEAKGLVPLAFGDSSLLRLGEFVLAVGNPFGVGQSVTMGIVSAKGRADVNIVDYEDFIQTDAAINPGNSGGALVNLRGELIGINTAILSRSGGYQGIGFAIPTNMVQPILQQIREHGRVRRGWLGIAIQNITPDLANSLDLGNVEGVLISDVMENGPGAQFDIKQGDVVVSVNGKPTKTTAQLRNAIGLLGPGAQASLTILREGKKKVVQVTLAEKKDDSAPTDTKEGEKDLLAGLRLQDLDAEIRQQLDPPAKLKGAVITEIEPGSPAAEAGLIAGDIVVEINKKRIDSVADVKKMKLDKAAQALLRIWRKGTYLYMVLRQ
jgi:serine protease Do